MKLLISRMVSALAVISIGLTFGMNATEAPVPSNRSIDEYITSYLRSVNSNKVQARDGKVAFFENTSVLMTSLVGGLGLLCLGSGAVLFFADRYAQWRQKVLASVIALMGAGFVGVAAYRIFARHMKSIMTYFLDEKGIYDRGLFLVSWKDLGRIEKGSNVAVSGNAVYAVNYVSLFDKFGRECARIFEGSESLPVGIDQFIAITEQYWNAYKGK